ncbi:ATE1 [Auxenochlorella protothecoides x Auxenochlorella symbiontica]
MEGALVRDYGQHLTHCAYCGKNDASSAHGMTAEDMSVQTYNALLDRGWRRSGTWLYKPCHLQTCCQLLTIRLEAAQFRPSKAQRKVLAQWRRYLQGGTMSTAGGSAACRHGDASTSQATHATVPGPAAGATTRGGSDLQDAIQALQEALDGATARYLAASHPAAPSPPPARFTQRCGKGKAQGSLGLTSAHAFVLAAWLRRQGRTGVEAREVAQALRTLLQRLPLGAEVEVAKGHLNFPWERRQSACASGTESQVGAVEPITHIHAGLAHSFERRLLPHDDPSLPETEFELFKKYQVHHHKEAEEGVTRKTFAHFLCSSPLTPEPFRGAPPGSCLEQGFGSFHQQYWLDGRLAAVSVIDILPSCISSKYFFWDPDLAHLSLGKVSSLLEIEWIQQARLVCPSLRYYYLGFYLHTCHRMRYKAEYQPSDLLCPINQCWVPFSKAAPVLESPDMPNLCARPGALEGLGRDHLVQDGSPMVPPVRPSKRELLDSQHICLTPSSQPAGGSPRQVILLRQLVAAVRRDALPAIHRLLDNLGVWAEAVGPVWRELVYAV